MTAFYINIVIDVWFVITYGDIFAPSAIFYFLTILRLPFLVKSSAINLITLRLSIDISRYIILGESNMT